MGSYHSLSLKKSGAVEGTQGDCVKGQYAGSEVQMPVASVYILFGVYGSRLRCFVGTVDWTVNMSPPENSS